MNIRFAGVENSLDIRSGLITVFEIENRHLFSRICQSLLSRKGEDACEPYTLWDDNNKEISPRNAFLEISNPFSLPWKDRSLVSLLEKRLLQLYMEDEDFRVEAETAFQLFSEKMATLGLQLYGDYSFSSEWDAVQYLKTFGYGVQLEPEATLLDNLILFIDFLADIQLHKPLIFINLKTFLNEMELETAFERLFFHNFPTLLLECSHIEVQHKNEIKYHIDQDFLEVVYQQPSGFPSSCSEDFASIVSAQWHPDW